MKIAYLDQNKWIELARAVKRPADYPRLQPLLRYLGENADAGRVVLPLTSANIYETHKVQNPSRRCDLAIVQCAFSKGFVIRGRQRRLTTELGIVLADCCGLDPPAQPERWFLSNVFFEAVIDHDDEILGNRISERVLGFIRDNPSASLFDYLTTTPEDVRTAATRNFSNGSERLRSVVEDRRRRHAGETASMRRRIYSTILMMDNVERVIHTANAMGIRWQRVQDIGSKNARRIIEEVPTYYIERELAVRIEAQHRPIEENDFRDMQSFCAAIPYVDVVIGENQFVNLARQAKLDRKFDTRLETDIMALGELGS